MGRMQSYSPLPDSPSRQLILDLARDLEQVRLHNTELKRVKAYERRSFYENLDRIDREREEEHNAALDAAAALHDQVRHEAEETLQEYLRQLEEERRRKEEEARKERERIEREKAEQLRREQEEAARREAERRAKEEEARKKAEEAERAKKAAEEERERKERERQEEEKRKREEERQKAEQDAARQKAEQEQQARAESQKQLGIGRRTQDEVNVHQRYLDLHKHLKSFRKWMREQSKTNATIKQNMGDLRRSIRKCVGQLREGKGANRTQLQEIRTTLETALSITEPAVDVREFIAFPPDEVAKAENTQMPALFIYILNILAKSLIASLVTEAAISPKYAEPIGIVAAQIFSTEGFTFNGYPLVDILWAKYRVFAPALWGFYGDERTEAGKLAVGWRREEPGGPFISSQAHSERMTGLGAGFAAITLRNFGKTTRKNPCPNTLFWHSMYMILSIPPEDIQETHLWLLAAMLRYSPDKIANFFGHFGIALMRRAIVDLPNSLPKQSIAAETLKFLRELYKREKNIIV
ncbi:hypothetical protein VTN00DRAFT_9755 [Thermoascus crustaceus]|uniref:uncharacterized protein n=1 Tax=Thermoascus crustaceus TaxID=5088 RepID=UPI003742503B